MKVTFALALLIAVSTPAFARDSSHLICAGYMAAAPGPDNYGLSVQFDEARAEDGMNRLEILSSVWGGDLYQGSRLNINDGFGENGTIIMAQKDDPKKSFYQGSYNVVQDATTGNYILQLLGKLNLDPNDLSEIPESISTTLPCINISN